MRLGQLGFPLLRGSNLYLGESAPATPEPKKMYEDSIVKAWVDWFYSGGVPTIRSDVNVSSLDDDATGDMGVNLATAMGGTAYAVLVSAVIVGGAPDDNVQITSKAAGAVELLCGAAAGAADTDGFLALIGNN